MSTSDRSSSLLRAGDSSVRVICSATALNAGYDLPSIDAAIVAAGVSTELVNIQQIGRTVRIREGKHALIINLFVDKTQERVWVESKLKNMDSE